MAQRSTADFSSKPWDIVVTRGDSPIIPLNVSDSAGTDVPLTGATVTMFVTDGPDEADTLLFSVVGILVGGGDATFQPTNVNLDITPGKYYYSIYLELASGEDRTILHGVFTIDKRPAQA